MSECESKKILSHSCVSFLPTVSFTHAFTDAPTYSSTHIHLLTHSLTRARTHSLTHLPTQPQTHSLSLCHSISLKTLLNSYWCAKSTLTSVTRGWDASSLTVSCKAITPGGKDTPGQSSWTSTMANLSTRCEGGDQVDTGVGSYRWLIGTKD